jgi:4-amino-4-deoxy-L-arabinose transferase-like glycosyltransferase
LAKSSSIREWLRPDQSTKIPPGDCQVGPLRSAALFALFAALLIILHAPLLRLPYFWDEAGYYIPAARDLLAGSLIPHSTPSNAHPPLVLAWLALAWKIFGQSPLVTRCTMLLLAAFSLLGFFRLARTVSNSTVAAASTSLMAVYPVFFAQSSLAQIDLPAAGLAFWALEAYVERRSRAATIWFSLAALAKETAILIPIALFLWKVFKSRLRQDSRLAQWASAREERGDPFSLTWFALLLPIIPLSLWYAYHFTRTGVVFGNPEFFRYNVQRTLHALRILLALLLRSWQAVGYLGLYVLTFAGFLAMKYPPLMIDGRFFATTSPVQSHAPTTVDREPATGGTIQRPRIAISIQLSFLAITLLYVIVLSVIGGAVLARYMLPIVALWILVCVCTIWRRLRPWKAVLAIVAAAFVASLFVNPPYGFSPEDNLAYRDYIFLHQGAEAFLESRYPHARVLTAWPASDELSHPYLGYVAQPIQVVKIEDFTLEQMLSVAEARSRFDVALIFSTKYQPPHSVFDRLAWWREWKARYFGYHIDLSPEMAAPLLGGRLVYAAQRHRQWVGVIEMEKIEEAGLGQLSRWP